MYFTKKDQTSNQVSINGTIKEEVKIVSDTQPPNNEVIKMTFFSKVETWFRKVFNDFPGWEKVASSTLTYVAPLLETAIALTAGTPAAAEVATIIGKIQSDLGVAAVLIEILDTSATLTGALSDIQTALPTLLTAVQVSDPTTVTKVTAIVTEIVGEINAVAASVASAVAAPAPAAVPATTEAPAAE
jgi:hypothetical protein